MGMPLAARVKLPLAVGGSVVTICNIADVKVYSTDSTTANAVTGEDGAAE